MSKKTSRWGVVGMFMNAPKLRSSSRKKKEQDTGTEKTQQPEDKSAPAVEAPVGKDDPPRVLEEAVNTIAERQTLSIAESLADEQLYKSVPQPAASDSEWTKVDEAQQKVAPSLPRSSASFPDAEDTMDVLSQSASAEFLDRQVLPLSNDPTHDIEVSADNSAQIATLKAEMRELEGQLDNARGEVVDLRQKNQELVEDNVRQAQSLVRIGADMEQQREELLKNEAEIKEASQKIRRLEDTGSVQLLVSEKLESDVKDMERRLEEMRMTLTEKEEENIAQSEKIQQATKEHQGVAKELEILHIVEADMKRIRDELEHSESDRTQLSSSLGKSEKYRKELEEEKHRLVELCRNSEDEIKSLQTSNLELKTTLEGSLADFKAVSAANTSLQNQVAQQKAELMEKQKQIDLLKQSHVEPTAQHPQHQTQLEVLERRSKMLVDQLRRLSNQLRQRTAGTESQIQPDPSVKDEGVVTVLVNTLNSEIFQVAAHMAETLDFAPRLGGAHHASLVEARGSMDRASSIIGRPMSKLLQWISSQKGTEYNPLPVQVGLQACLVSCCAKIAASWCPGHWDYGDFLAAIYLRISATTPNVATRWRVITERQLKTPSDDAVQLEMEEYLLKSVAEVLTISGWQKTPANARNMVLKFRDRVGQIARLALRLNMLLGDVWEVMVVDADQLFNEKEMSDAYDGNEETQAADRTVCTTDLGLKRSIKGEPLLKPKVVLRATLTEETGYDSFTGFS